MKKDTEKHKKPHRFAKTKFYCSICKKARKKRELKIRKNYTHGRKSRATKTCYCKICGEVANEIKNGK